MLGSSVSTLQSGAPKVCTRVVDIRNSQEIDKWVKAIMTEYGRLNCAANVAGHGNLSGLTPTDLMSTPYENWVFVMAVNTTGQ